MRTIEWVLTCAGCDRPIATLIEQFGPHDTPVCWSCHTAERMPVSARLTEADRDKIVRLLKEAIEHDAEAESYRDDVDRAESAAEEIRDQIERDYGLSHDAIGNIQYEIDLEQTINWEVVDCAPADAVENRERDLKRLARWQAMAVPTEPAQ